MWAVVRAHCPTHRFALARQQHKQRLLLGSIVSSNLYSLETMVVYCVACLLCSTHCPETFEFQNKVCLLFTFQTLREKTFALRRLFAPQIAAGR